MAVQKIGRIRLGEGPLNSGTYCEMTSGSATPSNLDGSDGDIYFKVAGANSDVFIKRDGAWESLIGLPLTTTLTDNATTTIITVPAAAARYLKLDYLIQRGSDYRSGQFATVNDSSDANISDFGQSLIGDTGVTFDAVISGTDLLIQATLTNTGSNASLVYKFQNWS